MRTVGLLVVLQFTVESRSPFEQFLPGRVDGLPDETRVPADLLDPVDHERLQLADGHAASGAGSCTVLLVPHAHVVPVPPTPLLRTCTWCMEEDFARSLRGDIDRLLTGHSNSSLEEAPLLR